MTPPRQPRSAGLRLVGTLRRDRASLLRSTALQAAVLSVVALPAAAQPAPNARPMGGAVVAGSASIGQTASSTTVNQSSQRAAVNWQSFDVGSQQAVVFNQPTSSAVTLNRVLSPNPSAIAGQIKANGTVVLTNQSGLVFYPGAQVDAQGVILSAAGITNKNFMAGKMVFDQAAHPGAAVVNQGSITVGQAGLAALVAPQVANSGVITAKLGHVVLAGAEAATLDMYGDGLLSIDVTKQVTKAGGGTALVTNTGTVLADGGTVQITAAAADGVVQTLVNAGGRIQANSIGAQTGTIVIEGTGGSLQVTGSVVAQGRAAGTTGGQIELNASGTVALAASARVSASSQAGGGTVAVGTTLARANGGAGVTPALTASAVTVAAGARISADARSHGPGGRVTLLSTGATNFAGRITARGGTAGGDGGLVELSGNTVALGGSVDVLAPAGNPWHMGSILLDPQDLVVSDTLVAQGTTSVLTSAQVEGIAGNITLTATHDLTVASSVTLSTASQALTLDAGHDVTVDSGVTISTLGSISLIAADSSLASTPDGSITIPNAVAAPTVVTTTGVLSLTSGTTDIALGGSITAAQLVLNAGAGVVQTPTDAVSGNANVVSVGTVSGSVGSLSLAGGNAIATLGTLAATSGNVAITEAPNTALAVTGSVTVPSGNTIALTTDTLAISGSLNAGTGMVALAPATSANGVLVKASGANAVNALNLALGDLQNIAAGTLQLGGTLGGAIAIGNAGDLINLRNITTLNLLSGGAITEGGSLSVGTLSGAASSVTLTGGNTISTLGSFSSSAGFALTDSNTLFVNASVIDPTGITLTTTSGDIQLFAELSTTTGTLSLHSAGAITQGGGLLDAATLTGTAGSVTLDGQNIIHTLGSFTSSAGFVLADSFALLTVAGPVQAGTGIALTELEGLQLNGTLAGTGGIVATPSITLAGTGDITQSATSKLFTTSLTSSGTITGNVTLAGQNAIGTLAGFAATGNLSVSNATALTATGTIAAGNGQTLTLLADSLTATGATLRAHQGTITLAPYNAGHAFSFGGTQFAADATFDAATLQIGSATAGNISITGVVDPGVTVLDLATAGSITQDTASVLTVPTLTGSVQGGVSLLGINAIGTLDGFTSAGGFTLVNGQTLTVTGSVQDGTGIALTENGGLQLNGTLAGTGGVAATPSITLAGTGDITQATTAELVATSLSSTGTIAGNVTLGGPNTIATLAGFAVSGNLSVRDSAALTATGTIAAGNGQTLTLLADSLTATGATLRAHQGRVVLAPNTANHAISFGNALFGADATFDATTLQVGSATAGNIGITGVVDPGVTVLDLVSGGSITQDTASVITVATLTGSVPNGSVALLGTNAIATLDGFTSSGGFALVDGQTLTVAGVSDPTGISLTTTSGDIMLAGDVTTTGTTIADVVTFGSLLLSSARAIMQTGGTVTAATLDGTAALGVGLTATGNSILSIGSFTAPGGFTLTTAGGLVLDGVVNAGAASVVLNAGGTITETLNGAIDAGPFTGIAAAATLLGSNDVTALTGLNAFNGNFLFNSIAGMTIGDGNGFGTIIIGGGGTLQLNGTLQANSIALSAPGDITQSAGTVSATTSLELTSTAGGFTQSGGTLTAASTDITVENGLSQIDGLIQGTTSLVLTSNAGSIIQTGGTMVAGTLSGAGADGVSLAGPLNTIHTLAGLSAGTGSLLLQDNTGLAVIGSIFAGGPSLNLNVTGSLSLAATGTLNADNNLGTIELLATGAISQAESSVLNAALLVGSGSTVSLTSDRNLVASLSSFSATAGNFALSDAEALSITGAVTTVAGQTLTLAADSITAGTGGTLTATEVALQRLDSGAIELVSTGADPGTLALDQALLNIITAETLSVGGTLLTTSILIGDAGHTIALPGVAMLDLLTAGAITEGSAAALSVGTLTGTAASVALGGPNLIGTLADFSSPSGFSLVDAQTLTVTGSVSDPDRISLQTTSGDLVLRGVLGSAEATGTIDLISAGAITQFAGSLSGATLTGSARGTVDLGWTNNIIGSLTGFTSSGGFTFVDGPSFNAAGISDPSSVSLTSKTGNLSLNVATTGLLELFAASDISATGVSAGSVTGVAGGNATISGGIGDLDSFSSSRGFSLTDGEALLVTGPVIDPTRIAITTTSGGITLDGVVSSGGTANGEIELISAGAISQTGGSLVGATLTGSAQSTVGLVQVNSIATLDGFTSIGGFTLVNAGSLLVSGAVSDSTDLPAATSTLSLTNAGPITLDGVLSAPTIDLVATTLVQNGTAFAGNISQIGGSLEGQLLTGGAGSLVLTGSASGTTDLAQLNGVTTLAGFASGGSFLLNDEGGLTVTGSVTVGAGLMAGAAQLTLLSEGAMTLDGVLSAPTISLVATALAQNGTVTGAARTGSISQIGGSLEGQIETGGTIGALVLTGSASGTVDLGMLNSVTTLAGFSSTGGFTLVNEGSLTVSGTIIDTAPFSTLSLTNAGPVILDAVVSAPTIDLDVTPLEQAGVVVGTAASGSITQIGGSLVSGGGLVLTGSATGTVDLAALNDVTTLATFSSAGGFTLVNEGTLTVTGPVEDSASLALANLILSLMNNGPLILDGILSAPTIVLTAHDTTSHGTPAGAPHSGTITQIAGALEGQIDPGNTVNTVSYLTLNGSATGTVDLPEFANSVTTIGTFSSVGGFTLDNHFIQLSGAQGTLTVNSISDPNSIVLNMGTGDLVLQGTLSSGTLVGGTPGETGFVQLVSQTGSIDQTGGLIAAVTLTGSAAGTADLGQAANIIGTLNGFTSTGGFTLNDTVDLNVASIITDTLAAGTTPTGFIDITTAGSLTLAATLTNGDTIYSSMGLFADGTISQTGGFIETGTLTGSGAAATLDSTGNLIASLGSFTGHAGVLLTDAIPLTIAGTLGVDPGNTIRIRNDALTIAPGGQVVASAGTVALAPSVAGHAQSVAGGNGGGGASSVIADTLIIGGGTNRVAQASALSLPGAFNLSGVRLIDLLSTGDIIQTGLIVQPTGSLTGIGANVGLTGAGNEFATLAGFTAGGNFALVSAGEGLTITGLVQAGSQLALDVTGGGITLGSGATGGTLATPALITLTTNQAVTQPNGGIQAGTLSLAASSAALTGANAIGTLATVGVTNAFDLADATSLTVAGPVTANRATFGITGNLVLDGRIAVAADLDTFVTGSITQPGGTVQANSLTGSAAAVALGQANAIDTLGSFSVGSFFLNDLSALTIAGPVTAGSVQLVDAGGVTLAGNLSASTLAVSAQGALVQTGGALSLGTLTGAAAAVALNDANAIGTVDGFTSAGAFSLATTGDLQIAGLLAAGSQVTLNVGGTLSENAGSITAPSLTGTAAASLLTGPNRIQSIANGGFDPPGDFVLQDQVSLAINGPLTAATLSLSVLGDLVLNAPLISSAMTLDVSGAITQPGGSLSTGSLTGNAASAMLDQPNGVGTLAGFTTAGAFSLVDSGSLTVSGPLAAATATLQTGGAVNFAANVTANVLQLAAAGSAVQSGGVLNVGTLSGSAGQLAQFGADGNGAVAGVGTLGPFTVNGAGGELFLADSQALTLQPPLAADFIAISAPGSVILAGGSVTTGGLPVATQGAGTAPQGPGSYIHVTGAGATFRQTGSTSINPAAGYATATLRIQTDGVGSILLDSLVAPRLDLILDAGAGASNGSIVVGGLTVLGSTGSAALTGLVDGFGGKVAARVSNITPTANRNYQINACPLQSVNCVVLSVQAVPVPAVLNDVAIGALAAPPDDPDLLLPNISDRDY